MYWAEATYADLWIAIWEELRNFRQKGTLSVKGNIFGVVDEMISRDRVDMCPKKELPVGELGSPPRARVRDCSVLFRPSQFSPVRRRGASPDEPF